MCTVYGYMVQNTSGYQNYVLSGEVSSRLLTNMLFTGERVLSESVG
jgi:hypothetical protein